MQAEGAEESMGANSPVATVVQGENTHRHGTPLDQDKENFQSEAGKGMLPPQSHEILARGIEVCRQAKEAETPRQGLLRKSGSGQESWLVEVRAEDGSARPLSLSEFCGSVEDEDPLDLLLCGRTQTPIRRVLEDLQANCEKSSPSKEPSSETAAGMKRSSASKRLLNKEKGDSSSKQKKAKSENAAMSQDLTIQQPFNVPQWRFTPRFPDPRGVMLSPYDRAPQLRLADENLTVSGYKGYRLIRATHGVTEGAWYCELTIREDHMREVDDKVKDSKPPGQSLESVVKGHCRFGWARSSAYMQAPVGYDRFGYAFASKTGQTVHLRRGNDYWKPLQEGDVVGCYLYLPPLPEQPVEETVKPGDAEAAQSDVKGASGQTECKIEAVSDVKREDAEEKAATKTETDPEAGDTEMAVNETGEEKDAEQVAQDAATAHAAREPLLWRDTGVEYYLDEDTDTGTAVHEGSVVRFFVNGEHCGVAFENIQQGKYYPAVGLYYGGQVTYNFGPSFKYPLQAEPDGVLVRAASELAKEEVEKAQKEEAEKAAAQEAEVVGAAGEMVEGGSAPAVVADTAEGKHGNAGGEDANGSQMGKEPPTN